MKQQVAFIGAILALLLLSATSTFALVENDEAGIEVIEARDLKSLRGGHGRFDVGKKNRTRGDGDDDRHPGGHDRNRTHPFPGLDKNWTRPHYDDDDHHDRRRNRTHPYPGLDKNRTRPHYDDDDRHDRHGRNRTHPFPGLDKNRTRPHDDDAFGGKNKTHGGRGQNGFLKPNHRDNKGKDRPKETKDKKEDDDKRGKNNQAASPATPATPANQQKKEHEDKRDEKPHGPNSNKRG